MKFLHAIVILIIGLYSIGGTAQGVEPIIMRQTDFEIITEKMMASFNKYNIGTVYHEELNPIYTYYQNKNWLKGIDILKSISEDQILENDKSTNAGILGFVTGLILDNPDKVGELENMKFSTDMQNLIKKGSQIAFRAQNIETILKSQHGKHFTAKQLDSFWGMFFATGDQRIPEEIAYFGTKNAEPERLENDQVLVDENVIFALSALASVQANSAEHEKVKAAVNNLPAILFYENALENSDSYIVQEWDRFK